MMRCNRHALAGVKATEKESDWTLPCRSEVASTILAWTPVFSKLGSVRACMGLKAHFEGLARA